MGRMYSIALSGLAVTGTNEFLQMRNIANRSARIHSISVFQISTPSLAMNGIRLNRGTGGSGGTDRSSLVRKGDNVDTNAGIAPFELTSTPISSVDWDAFRGWNILQEYVWLPTPRMQIELAASNHFGLSLVTGATLTIGLTVVWEEKGT